MSRPSRSSRADGRILAHDILAPLPLPPFTNSAVDGYAVSSRDLPQTAGTGISGDRSRAGRQLRAAPVKPGQAMRIFTGAPMPDGADTVFMQEDVRVEGDKVVLPAGLKPGANVRPAGEDIAARPCGAEGRPAAAAAGCRARGGFRPDAARRRQAHSRRGVLHRRRAGLAGRAARGRAIVRFQPLHADGDAGAGSAATSAISAFSGTISASLAHALQEVAGTHDLILTTGGVSTGEEDHVKAGVESVGRLVLWRMAIKPGRPVAMGIIGGTPFIGLPGNPVASFVTFVHVVRPTILALSGALPEPLVPMPVRAGFTYRKKIARREYVRVTLRKAADGALEAVKFPREGAGMLSSLVDTDGLVELGEDSHAGRAGPDGRLPVLCQPDQLISVDDASALAMFDPMTTTKLDLAGLKCPLPALKTRKALKTLPPGDRLEVLCTDPLSVIDIPNLIRETGDKVEITERNEGRIVFLIEKSNG